VIRSDLRSRRVDGRKVLDRVPPTFGIRVYRELVGEVVRVRYRPRKAVPLGRLADDVVTRLVRQALKGI
jgi:hypothetical protein